MLCPYQKIELNFILCCVKYTTIYTYEMCDYHKQILAQLRTGDEPPVLKINKFIDECGPNIVEFDLPTFKILLQLTSQYAYNFRERRPKLNLADCMNIMLKDMNSITDNPILKHYYDAMLLEFLQRSLAVVNAEREHIAELDPKIMENFDKFKECAALQ